MPVYTKDDVATVQRIRYLLKEEQYTIAGAKKAIERGDTRHRIHEDLRSLRSFLVRLRDQL